jgi:hypothetical protein
VSISRPNRRALLAAGGALTVALAAVTPASAVQSKSLNYQCKYPLVGTKKLSITIDLDTPATYPVGQATPEFGVTATASAFDMAAALTAVEGLTSIKGTSTAYSSVRTPSGGVFDAPTVATIPDTTFPDPFPNPLVLIATGATPSLTFSEPGVQTFMLDRLAINLTALDPVGDPIVLPPVTKDIDGNKVSDSDGDANTFDVYCKLDAGQDTTLGTLEAVSAGTPTPTDVPPTPTPTDVPPTPTPTPTDVPPTPTPTPTNVPPTPTATATPTGGPVARLSYNLKGTTGINTLTKGTLPLTGEIAAQLQVLTGEYTATTTLNDTQGRLTALGFLPITATIGFVPSGPTTGKLEEDAITANLKIRIKIRSLKAFGIIPLAGGNTCQTKQLSDIHLASTDSFDPTGAGGTIGGSYAISDLNGCGLFNGLLSPLTAGGGNTITAKLTVKS